jgi:FkbM family methyltransferase
VYLEAHFSHDMTNRKGAGALEQRILRLRQRCDELKVANSRIAADRRIPGRLLGRLRMSALAGVPLRHRKLFAHDDEAEEAARLWREGARPVGAATREIGGLRWTIPSDSGSEGSLSHRIRQDGWLPFSRIQQVREFTTGGVMLDIGANIGTTAIPRVVMGDCSHVYAAEPHPDNFACLVGNVLDNDLEGYVLPSRVALSSRTGVAPLRVASRIGAHSIRQKPGADTLEVPCATLNDWVAQRHVDVAAIRFVKIDVQGHEGHVLLGGRELANLRPIVWQVEMSPAWITKSGVDLQALYAWIGETFDWVHVLGNGRPRAATECATLVTALTGERHYLDVLLGHGMLRDV